jgi:hypothetical protein
MAYPRLITVCLALASLALGLNDARAQQSLPSGVACLLEDNGAELLSQLTNPGGDTGEGELEKKVVFAGGSAIKITRYQRYFNLIPGWAYRIREKPGEQEYRYLRFAWKADQSTGMMLQLHDEKDWHIRYLAGLNKFGWTATTIAQAPPSEWTVVTLDLFKDFGERELHGIALAAFDGTAGYFDHIYLAKSIDELDAIDASGIDAAGAKALTPKELEQCLQQLGSTDAGVAYLSFWTLAAGGEVAKTLVSKELASETKDEVTAATIAEWISQLDHENFGIREKATLELIVRGGNWRTQLEEQRTKGVSEEVRGRLDRILAGAPKESTEGQSQAPRMRRILQIIAERKE